MIFSQPIHLVGAKRSPIGKLGGALAGLSAVELATQTARQTLVSPNDTNQIGQVVFGQGLQAGVGMNLARQVALNLGCGPGVTGFTVNMVCGSGLQAIGLAAKEIAVGEFSVVLAGGAESMSNAPHYARLRGAPKFGDAQLEDAILRDGLTDPNLGIAMGETAERLAEKFAVSRAAQDQFALQSQQRASNANFSREIAPIQTRKGEVKRDEHPRADTTVEKLATLKPAFRPDGTVTAGNASGLNDGAAAVLLADETALQAKNWASRARLVGVCVAGCEPELMGLGPIGAIQKLCAELNWDLAEVDSIEINEAFAAQTLACAGELGIDPEKLNRRGGAIALGHPIGCSGARVLVTLLHMLEDWEQKRGIAALCIGGGMGIAAAIER